MALMWIHPDRFRQLSIKLIAAVLIAMTAMTGFGSTPLAHAQDPDTAVLFLVDESLSLAAIAGGGRDRLYDSVRFLNAALTIACQPGQCQTGVMRFSAEPVQLVPLKQVETWDERDFLRLDIGIQDRLDQSNFPAAFDEACGEMRRSTDAENKVIVILTDGQLGSQASPDIAPVQRDLATSRTDFIEDISSAIEYCIDSDVRLVTVLLNPSDLGRQPTVDQSAGSDSDQTFRSQEREMWQLWSETSGGAMIEAPAVDDAQSVRNAVASLAEILGIAMPEFVLPEGNKLPLGVIAPYRGSAQFEIVGLKPFRMEAESPDGSWVQADQVSESENRVSINVPLPREGQWVGNLLGPVSDNVFLVRPAITSPMHLQPHLSQTIGPIDQHHISANGEVVIELTTVPVGGNTPVVINNSMITATLTSPLGLSRVISFTADTNRNIYVAELYPASHRPSPGLYGLWAPTQTIDDVVVDPLFESVLLRDAPFVLDWYFSLTSAYVRSPFSLTIDLENSELLASPPEFDITWTADHGGTTVHRTVGQETRPGQFQTVLDETSNVSTTYKVGVALVGGENILGEPFLSSAPVFHDVPLIEKPTAVAPPSTNPENPEPPSRGISMLRILAIMLATAVLLAVFWVIALFVIPAWLRSTDDPLKVHERIEEGPLSWRVLSWPLRPIRAELDKLQSERLEQVEQGQIDRAIEISRRRLQTEAKLENDQLISIEDWDNATSNVLSIIRNSSHRLREVRTFAASHLFCDLLERRDPATTTGLDLINDLYIQGFEPDLES